MNRRDALKTITALLPAALALPGCSGTTLPSAITTAASDIASIAGALPTALTTTLLTSLGLSSATVTTIEGYLSTIGQDAASVASSVAAATAPSTATVQTIITLAEDAINIVAPLLGATEPEMAIIADAVSLLPTIAAAFGITAATAPRLAALKLAALPDLPAVDPAVARQDLQQWIATHPPAAAHQG